MSSPASPCPPPRYCLSPHSLTPTSSGQVTLSDTQSNTIDIDQYVRKAYGDIFCRTTVPETSANEWIRHWSAITHLKGRLYHVPGGSIGRKYVDLLSTEISHLAAGNYLSERLMVFSVVILQCNRMLRKGSDVRRVVERQLKM